MATTVPSAISPSATTRKAIGNDLLERQCVGKAVHKKYGLPVWINSPWWSTMVSKEEDVAVEDGPCWELLRSGIKTLVDIRIDRGAVEIELRTAAVTETAPH